MKQIIKSVDCGYGSSFIHWIEHDNAPPYNSYGNGSAMRVSYVADFYEDLEDVKKNARAAAAVSHNHPEGIKGAEVTAVCIWMARVRRIFMNMYWNSILRKYTNLV